jgi:hypothetical protein
MTILKFSCIHRYLLGVQCLALLSLAILQKLPSWQLHKSTSRQSPVWVPNVCSYAKEACHKSDDNPLLRLQMIAGV